MRKFWRLGSLGQGKKEGKDGGKEDGKSKDGGAKWVEKKGSSKGERRTDQWQPKDPQLQMAQMQMQSGNAKGKGAMAMGNMAYDYAAQATYVPQGNGGKKKGGNRDPKMDDWLSARFNGQVGMVFAKQESCMPAAQVMIIHVCSCKSMSSASFWGGYPWISPRARDKPSIRELPPHPSKTWPLQGP